MTRTALRALALDLGCVLLMVVIGTRNHETDTGVSGVLFVATPFWIATLLAHLAPMLKRSQESAVHVLLVWSVTVAVGMTLRNLVFNRGTALAFVIVATVFLGATMYGWRALSRRWSTSKQRQKHL